MNDLEFQKAYGEQNQRDYIANARFGSIVSIPLNLSCSIMDYFMYPSWTWSFFKLRVACGILTSLVWLWFTKSPGPVLRRAYGVTWFGGPLLMVLWMIYVVDDAQAPYYAGLNIILLAMGLISPWTYKQNLVITLFVLAMYVVVAFAMKNAQPANYVLNNTTFLFLTAAFVVLGSKANARQRFHEFTLRWELDKNRRAVEESNRKLTELDQAKSRFFANISHELRTPLTLLISPLETLMTRYREALGAEAFDMLGTMHSNGMRLLKLINDLLDLVRLDSGVMQVKREAVDIADFIRGLASAARQVADDKRIRLETVCAPEVGTVMVDRDKLEKMILNLQFNALKFTPAGGSVTVSAAKEGEELVLCVKDTGMGISEKNLPKLFSRFWQADDSSRRKYQGVGIGLALVKELAEVQSGQVGVTSQEGKGTTFTVRLPYLKPDVTAAPNDTASTPGPVEPAVPLVTTSGTVSSQEWLSNLYRRAELFPAMTPVQEAVRQVENVRNGNQPKALIADDEPDMLRFLKTQLQQHYQIIEAVDGQQAIDKASQFLPDVILLDMMMPEKDGLQACRELREHTATQSIPVILLTARADEQTKLDALKAGASDFLPKPFSTTELHVRVKNLEESYRFQRQLAKNNVALEDTIDQLKETETQLVQSEKLASLGRLSAGIIHEINNPLNFAATGLFTLRNKGKLLAQDQQSEYAEVLKDVEDGLQRVRTIVSDLRSFSHFENEGVDEVKMREAVQTALRFLSHEIGGVEIVVQIPDDQVINANKNKLVQVLVNLVQNSVDAVKKKTFTADKPTIRVEGEVRDGKSVIAVRDNGTGIESKNMDKIFDPFFTTKDVGEGMGLGLSIVYRIVQQYGGQISVKSEPGQYSEFILEFPDERVRRNGQSAPPVEARQP